MITTAQQVAAEHAAAIWSDPDARAEWVIGHLSVSPLIDAELQRLEASSLRGHDVLRDAAATWLGRS